MWNCVCECCTRYFPELDKSIKKDLGFMRSMEAVKLNGLFGERDFDEDSADTSAEQSISSTGKKIHQLDHKSFEDKMLELMEKQSAGEGDKNLKFFLRDCAVVWSEIQVTLLASKLAKLKGMQHVPRVELLGAQEQFDLIAALVG